MICDRWLSMDGFPKDGTPFLAICGEHRFIARYHNGSWWSGDPYANHWSPCYEPMGWLPLPPLPEERP